MRCLVCERHALFRIVMRFSREAVIAQKHVAVLEKFRDTHSAFIKWETPEFTKRKNNKEGIVQMKGAVAVIIIDRELPNLQKKTLKALAEGFKKEINSEDLDEGFIEINEVSDVVDLLPEKGGVKVCARD